VPARTRRDRAAKGKAIPVAPAIDLATDLAADGEATDETLSRLAPDDRPGGLREPADLYPYCMDQYDMDIIDLRYDDGAGPRCIAEVADLIGLDAVEVEHRLDMIETRVYRDLGRPKPKGRRSPGKRIFPVLAEPCRSC
jgi:hypothetical protein